MKFFLRQLLPLLLTGILLTGCEKQEYFKSKKGVDKELQGSWKRVPIALTDPQNEVWHFDGGTLTISSDNAKTMTGTYSIKTTLLKVFVTTEGLSNSCLNGKWQVIRLDDEVLDMVNDGCAGLTEKEFTKM